MQVFHACLRAAVVRIHQRTVATSQCSGGNTMGKAVDSIAEWYVWKGRFEGLLKRRFAYLHVSLAVAALCDPMFTGFVRTSLNRGLPSFTVTSKKFQGLQIALHIALAPLQGGSRFSSAAPTGRGSSSGSATAKEKAARYLKEKERRGSDAAEDGGFGDQRPTRLADAANEFTEAQQALFLSSPSGLGVGAEAAIAKSIADGAFDGLAGKGKPLKQEDHGAQFFKVDPLMQAVTRTMGAQGLKPPSLELRDELQSALGRLRHELQRELQQALAAEQHGVVRSQRSSTSSSVGGGSSNRPESSTGPGNGRAGWLLRVFGFTPSPKSDPACSGRTHQPTVDSIRAGEHPGLEHAADEVRKLIKQYNSAVLADKETLGSHWPLNQMKGLDWETEVEAALAAIGGCSAVAR